MGMEASRVVRCMACMGGGGAHQQSSARLGAEQQQRVIIVNGMKEVWGVRRICADGLPPAVPQK